MIDIYTVLKTDIMKIIHSHLQQESLHRKILKEEKIM